MRPCQMHFLKFQKCYNVEKRKHASEPRQYSNMAEANVRGKSQGCSKARPYRAMGIGQWSLGTRGAPQVF